MKKVLKTVMSVTLLFSALCMALPQASAADLKPVVTISFAGYTELMADVQAFGKISGRPELDKLLEGMLAMFTQGKGLAGLDQKLPIGAVMLTDGGAEFTTYAFLPVSDLKQIMETVKGSIGDSLKVEDGVYEIPLGMDNLYITQKGKWAFVAQKKETFAKVSDDPAKLIGDLPQKYLLAVKASVKNIPEPLVQQGLAMVRMGVEMSSAKNADESDVQYAARTAMMKQNIEQIETFSKELDEVLVGATLDRKTNSTYLDIELTAKPGTNLAAQLAANKPGKTNFAGTKLPGAAITFNGIGTIADVDIARAKITFESLRVTAKEELKKQELEKEQLELATGVLDELFDVGIKTLESKKLDYGAAVVLEPNAITFVAGSSVAEGAKIEGVLKKLLDAASKEEPDVAKFAKLNAETYKGIRFHTFTMPTPEPEMAPLVGDTLEVVLGINDKQVFLAAGRDANKTIKEAIDKSQSDAGKEILPAQVVVSGLKIAKFVAAVGDEQEVKDMAAKVADALEKSGGKDHVTFTSQPIANGVKIRLELEEGLLKAVGGIGPEMP